MYSQEHDIRSSQVNFAQQVQGMVEVIEEVGNPYGRNQGPTRLDTTDTVDPAVASSISCTEEKGIEQFMKFVADRLVERSTPISEPIK